MRHDVSSYAYAYAATRHTLRRYATALRYYSYAIIGTERAADATLMLLRLAAIDMSAATITAADGEMTYAR